MAQPKGRPQQQQQQHVNSVATNSYAMPAAASQTGNAAAAAAPLTDSLELCQSALSQPSKPRQQQQQQLVNAVAPTHLPGPPQHHKSQMQLR